MASWTADIRRFLEAHRVGHLATVDADGMPHVVPVCYAIDDAALYFVADAKPKRRPARTLKRLQNLQVNPRAALVVDHYSDDDWTRLAWVQVRGPAAIVTERDAHADALARLQARYPQYRSMVLDDPEAHPIVRITPAVVRSWHAESAK
jgi:PPOX class probable F420-dependent enzyme